MTNGLVKHLKKLWEEIEKEYKKNKNKINSEAALQCDMYRLLRKYTDKEKLIILVEPYVSIEKKEKKPFYPDMLVVKNRTIKFVVELKYSENYVPFENEWCKFY